MGYHPETLVFSFPPYPRSRKAGKAGGLYALKPWIGFDVWHHDAQRPNSGQRTDDSCGWFDRRPREYADAVAYVLNDRETMFEIQRAINQRDPVTGVYGHTYPRMSAADTLAVCLMLARELEQRRWWNGQNGKEGVALSGFRKLVIQKRNVDGIAYDLALSPLDNLQSIEEPAALVRLMAGAMARRFKPWWAHPRWHIHHWQINFDLPRNLRRMFQPCATCRKSLGFNYCPTQDGSGRLHHGECLGHGVASARQ